MLGALGKLPLAAESTATAAKGGFLSQKGLLATGAGRQATAGFPGRRSTDFARLAAVQAQTVTLDVPSGVAARRQAACDLQVLPAFPEGASGSLPEVLYRLLDPAAAVELPPPGVVHLRDSDNRELDKLVAALGRNKATWRRALQLHEWLLQIGYRPDDRLCTTLIRVCSQHGQATTALAIYDWMRAAPSEGGAGLTPTVFTYTAAMRAALTGSLMDRALQVWEDAVAAKCEVDCRLCTTLIEVCGRKGDTDRALQAYAQMRDAPRDSRMAPSVHAYTAAMRAASEGGRWEAALAIWEDMQKAGCKPTGHAYAAVISACAAGGQWQKAVSLFDEMLAWGVRPDVVSCTALITALGTDGQWERAEKVVEWMLRSDIKPNVRTYTALITALGNAKQWDRALDVVRRMRRHSFGGGLEPNAYTYSALLKTMGEQGKWQLAERFFRELEAEQLELMAKEAAAADVAASRRQLAAAMDGAAAGAVGPEGAALLAATQWLQAAAAPSPAPQEPAVSAFPGMHKQLPTGSPAASDAVGSNPEAIAAAAAAVAAMAAAHHQQQLAAAAAAAAAEEESDGLRLVAARAAEQVLATPRSSMSVEAASPASAAESDTSADSATAPFFSYFSGAPSAKLAASSRSASPTTDAAPAEPAEAVSPSSVADVGAAFAAAFGPQHQQAAAAAAAAASGQPAAAWTNDNAAVRGLSFHLDDIQSAPPAPQLPAAAVAGNAVPAGGLAKLRPLPKGRGPVNEVVCGALMLAYERAGKWREAVAVLDRARALGIAPNTIMYNTAISALGKALRPEEAEALFTGMPAPDAVSHETMIAAYGMSGLADKAEAAFERMRAAGFSPRDYAYCGLIAAHSFKGDWAAALRVRERMRAAGVVPTVHVFNALIAACDRAHQYERAMALARDMQRAGVTGNGVTQSLLEGVCKEGVRAVESQQAAAAALSAAVAAAGTLMIRAGIF